MEARYSVLLDAPADLGTRVQIARLGPVSDPRYGDFEITEDNARNWQRNLSVLPGRRALIDFEHRSERKPRDSEAAGWITGIGLDGQKVMADVEWTSKGEQAIKDKRYLFVSPAYGKYRDETGAEHDDTLCSTALTNKPALGSLPMLTLASEESLQAALEDDPAERFYRRALDGELGEQPRALVLLDVSAGERKLALKEGNALPDGSYPIRNTGQLHAAAHLAASGHGNVQGARKLIKRRAKELGVDLTTLPGFDGEGSDSRRAMDAELLTLLDLEEGADDSKVLEKVSELKAKAETPEPAERKTLEQQAADDGKVLLDSAKYTELESNARAGKHAADELAKTRFETSYQRALDAGRAVPAQKEQLEHFYQLDAQGTLKMLDEGPQLVNVRPSGLPVELDDASAGLTPAQQLDRRVKDKLKELGKGMTDYPTVLEQLMTEDEVA